MGPRFRKDAKKVEEAIAAIPQPEREILAALQKDGQPVKVTVDGLGEVELEKVEIVKRQKQQYIREYTPNVIEPSFGIGRILYSLIEHIFYTRPEDATRGVLAFPPKLAPTKVLIVPLSGNKEFNPIVDKISRAMRKEGIANRIDDSSATIGKRYARNDELGTPFGVTVDFQTLKDGTITLRERDSMKQIRSSVDKIVEVVRNMVDMKESWEKVLERFGEFQGQELE
jgi:glycyl-tRNA synthetase